MKSMIARAPHSIFRRSTTRVLLAALGTFWVLAGCSQSDDETTAEGPTKVKVCYIGLTCEPPIYVAYELGLFKEEGIDVELVKTDWDSMRDGLGLGRFDATHTLIMYLLKPIDQGLDVKLTGGIHSGCLRLQAAVNSDIKTVRDLKGKRIGISHMGAPPFLFASRVLAAEGIDPQKDVEWVTFPLDAVELALDRGQVDAVAAAEPIGTLLLSHEKVHKVLDQALDQPYANEFCCVTAVNGTFAAKNPKAAAAVTRALLKGAKWVSANKSAAAKLAVEKGYLASTADLNVQAIKDVKYQPKVAQAKRDILQVAKEMKAADFLGSNTDPQELVNRAWIDLDGVTDEWIEQVRVEKIVGGGDPPELSRKQLAALFDGNRSCCGLACCEKLEHAMPLTGEWAKVKPLVFDPSNEKGKQGEIQLAQPSH